MWSDIVSRALAEDRVDEDATTLLLGEAARVRCEGRFVAQEHLVVAGIPAVAEVYRQLGGEVEMRELVTDGIEVAAGTVLIEVAGPGDHLVRGERTALNLMQRLSGVASATRAACQAVAGSKTRIADTRKTTPGLRDAEKYAVRVGGGINNRSSLAEAVFIKDNHWMLMRRSGVSLRSILRDAHRSVPIVVEVDDEDEFRLAVDAGAKHILADNQTPETISRWVQLAGAGVVIEASGGIDVRSVADYAAAGAAYISLGAITHSARAMSISFDLTR